MSKIKYVNPLLKPNSRCQTTSVNKKEKEIEKFLKFEIKR